MKTLLILILLFLMFGWLGVLIAGLGFVVALDWLAHNFGIVILIVAGWAYWHFCRVMILGKGK